MTTRQSEEYFFHQRCEKMSTNPVIASWFWLAAYAVRLFDFHFTMIYFKFSILAYKMCHNAWQSDNNNNNIVIIIIMIYGE